MTSDNDNGNATERVVSLTQSNAAVFSHTRMRKADTEDGWLKQREPFIGASAAAALFGEHPFITLGQLAHERRTGARAPDNAAMMRGRFLEDGVARWWSHVHCTPITEVNELFVCNDVLVATLDRVLTDVPVILEIKTTARRVHDVERSWWWQCQAQLACTGYEHVEVAVLDSSMALQSFTVDRDDNAMHMLVNEAAVFLQRVADGDAFTEPEPVPPDSLELGAEARSWVRAWRFAQSRDVVMHEDIDRLKGMIDHALGEHDSGTVNGHEVVRRQRRKGSRFIDGPRLRKDHPDIAEDYTYLGNPSEFLVLK